MNEALMSVCVHDSPNGILFGGLRTRGPWGKLVKEVFISMALPFAI